MVSSPQGVRTPVRFRTIFLSDVHLGSPHAQAELLLDFLAHHQAEFLYLVGDIADDAVGRPPASWPDAHRDVLVSLRRIASSGTLVHHMRGNHDPRFHELWGEIETLRVAREAEHETADGRRLLVVHGDLFDAVAHRRPWLVALGEAGSRAMEAACGLLERLFLRRPGRLGRSLRERCKRWLGYTGSFERSALLAVRRRALDGIICGHAHAPASRTVGGLYYGNGGDWVGSATALVEHVDGRLELLAWSRAA
jgi:UDP-2,3-diacylglucosamine pyrophosphatase LpxH